MKKSPKSLPSSKRKGKSLAILAFLAAAVPASQSASAVTVTWDGGISGTGTDWSAAANWRPDTLPGVNDTVQFGSINTQTNTACVTVLGSGTITNLNQYAGNFQIGQTVTGSNIPAGSVITAIINGSTIVISNPATGSATNVSLTVLNTGGLATTDVISLGGNQTIAGIFMPGTNKTFTIGSSADVAAGNTLTITNHSRVNWASNALTIASNVNLLPNATGRSTWAGDSTIGGGGVTTITGTVGSVGNVVLTTGGVNGFLTLNGTNTFTGGVQAEAGTLTLGGTNSYTGTSTASGGTLAVKFNSSTATDTINAASGLVLGGIRGGGTLTVTGNNTANSVNSQTFNGVTINPGNSTLNIVNGISSGKTLVSLGDITRNKGGTVNFVQPTVNTTISATNGYTTTTANDASGILGAYATVGGANWATNSGTNIIAYTGYNTPTGSFPTVATDATTNLRVNNTSSGVVSFATTGTVDVNTLLVNDTAARTIFLNTNDTLRFGAVGGILTPTSTGALTIGYLDDGETMTAGGADNTAGELIINNATAIGINPTIANNGTGVVTLTKAGAGTLTLNAASTYSGGTFVNGGTLAFGSTGTINQLSTTGDITVSGGTLNFGANGQTTSGAVVLQNGTISSGTLTKIGGYYDLRNGTVSTRLMGAVGFVKTTSGAVTFSNTVSNAFTGVSTIREGTLTGGGAAAVTAISGDLVVGSVTGGNSAAYATSGNNAALNTSKTITIYSNGSVNLGNPAHTMSGVFNIFGGSLYGGQMYLSSPTFNLKGGSLSGGLYSGDGSFNILASDATSTISATGGLSYTFNVADGVADVDLLFSGVMNGTGKSLTKTGSGLMRVTSNQTYTGTTNVNGGTLRFDMTGLGLSGSNMLYASGTSNLVLGGGGNATLDIVGRDAQLNTQNFLGNVTVNSGYSTIAASSNVSGTTNMIIGANALTRNAGGVLNLVTPAQGSFTTNVASPIIVNGLLTSAASNGLAYATINGTDWATVSGGAFQAYTGYSTGNANYVAGNNMDVTDGDAVTDATVNTLRFNSATAGLSLTGTNTVSAGGILVTPTSTAASITGGAIQTGGGSELVVINNGQLNIASSIIGTGKSLTLAGTGITTLSGSNSFTGNTNLYSGTLLVGHENAVGAGTLILAGGTLASTSSLTIARPTMVTIDSTIGGSNDLTFAGVFTASSGGNRTLTVNNTGLTTMSGTMQLSSDGNARTATINGSGNMTVSGPVNGGSTATVGSNLIYAGSGVLTLSNANNAYAGTTTIQSGTLSVSSLANETVAGSSIIASGANTLTLTAQAVIDLKNAGVTVGTAIAGTGIAGGTTITDITDNIVTLSANATASGTNNLTYGTATNSGIGRSSAAATSLVIDGGTLQYTGADVSTNRLFSIGNSGTSTLDASGSGAVNFTNTGVVGMNNVQGERTLNLAGTNTGANTLAAVIGDSLLDATHLMKSGAGTWVITGSNTYTGNTTITSGTLSIGANGSIASTKRIDVRTGGTLDLSAQSAFTLGSSQTLQSTGVGTVTGPAGVLSANGTVAPGGVATTGTLNVIGSLTLAGTTLIDLNNAGGTLTWDMLTATTLTLGGVVTFNATGDAFVGGEVFTVLGASNWSGNFSSINLPALASGLTWDYSTLGVDGRLLVVPEPATWAFMVGGLGMLAFMKRARRNRL